MERPLDRAAGAWRPPLLALAVATAALAAALLVPRALATDPVAVDPYDLRLAALALGLAGAGAAWGRLAAMRSVLLALVAVVVPFCAWSATPDVLGRLTGGRLSDDVELLGANVVYVAGTLPIAVLAVRRLPEAVRPRLRLALRSVRGRALAAAPLGVAAVVGIGLALPAVPLGRLGIPVAAVLRDLPLLGPAFTLQAAAQELQFRGLLLGALERVMPPAPAVATQALLFGLAHIAVLYEGPVGALVPVTIALGLLLGWLTRWTGSLWPAIVIHAALEVGVAVAILPGLYGQ